MSHSFPAEIDAVPPELRLPEIIGVGFGAISLGGAIVAVGYGLRAVQTGLGPETLEFLGGALAVALISGAIEVLRRRKPIVLVSVNAEIGIYKGGQFVRAVSPNQLTWYKLSFVNTFRELLLFGFLGAGACLAALGTIGRPGAGIEVAWIVAGAVVCVSSAVNSLFIRVLAKHYFIPRDLASSALVFSKTSLRRVGWEK